MVGVIVVLVLVWLPTLELWIVWSLATGGNCTGWLCWIAWLVGLLVWLVTSKLKVSVEGKVAGVDFGQKDEQEREKKREIKRERKSRGLI